LRRHREVKDLRAYVYQRTVKSWAPRPDPPVVSGSTTGHPA
jgi:hypothetical protein